MPVKSDTCRSDNKKCHSTLFPHVFTRFGGFMFRTYLSLLLLFAIPAACSTENPEIEDNSLNISAMPEVVYCSGYVHSKRQKISSADIINPGSKLQSTPGSSCELLFSTAFIRMGSASTVSLKECTVSGKGNLLHLDMEDGYLLVKGFHDGKSQLYIYTPTAVISGAQAHFSVLTDAYGTTKISVFSGSVLVSKRIPVLDGAPLHLITRATEIITGNYAILTKRQQVKTENAYSEAIKNHKDPGAALDSIRDVLALYDKCRGVLVYDYRDNENEIIDISGIDIPETRVGIGSARSSALGTLTLTASDMYHSYNGKIIWTSQIGAGPVKKASRVYIAGNDRLYCASYSGKVVWMKNISYINDLRVLGNILQLETAYGTIRIAIPSGRIIE